MKTVASSMISMMNMGPTLKMLVNIISINQQMQYQSMLVTNGITLAFHHILPSFSFIINYRYLICYNVSSGVFFILFSQSLNQYQIYNILNVIRPMEITGVLQPPKRGKQLPQKQMKRLKKNIEILDISSRHKIHYCILGKQSKTGLFNNDRLFLLNTKEKSICYISKLPQGLLPLYTQQQASSLKSKSKVKRQEILRNEVKNFRCNVVKGKISTLLISFSRNNVEQQWIWISGNEAMRDQLVQLVNSTIVKQQPLSKIAQETIQRKEQAKQEVPLLKKEVSQPLIQQSVVNDNNPVTILNQQSQQHTEVKPYQRDYNLPPQNSTHPLTSQNKVQQNPHPNKYNLPPPPPQHINTSQSPFISSRIIDLPYCDQASQLQYLKKVKPQIFNLTNDLSVKKMPNYQSNYQNNINNTNTYMNHHDSLMLKKDPSRKIRYAEEMNNEQVESRYVQTQEINRAKGDEYVSSKNMRIQDIDRRNPLQRGASSKLISHDEVQPYKRTRSTHQNIKFKPQATDYDRSYKHPPQKQRDKYSINIKVSDSVNNQTKSLSRSKLQRQELIKNESKTYLNHNESRSKLNNNYMSQEEVEEKQNIILRNGSEQNNNFRLIKNGSRDKDLLGQRNSKNSLYFNSKESNGTSSREALTFNNKKSFHRKKWNEIFCQSSNKLQIYQDFTHTSYNIIRQIINELPLDDNQKTFLPIESNPPFSTYYSQGIIITIHYFQNSINMPTFSSQRNAPLLYNQSTYEHLKRQFYNYNLLLSVTGNQSFVKVPLCAYFEYKGIIALCKGEISEDFGQITPKRFQKQFDEIENAIHLRFMYGSFNAYLHPNNKYLIVYNMRELIPEVPIQNKEHVYFRKEFLLNYSDIIEDLQTSNQANYHITHQVLPQFINKLQTLQTYIVSSTDLKRLCHQNGISLGYLPLLIHLMKSTQLKKLLITELVSSIFVNICRSQINSLYANFPLEELRQMKLQDINEIIKDSYHTLIELMFGYSNSSQNIWRLIVEQCGMKHKVTISKEDVVPGYLLSAIIEKLGLICDFRKTTFDKQQVQFFIKSDNIPKDLFVGFRIHIRRYDLASISPLVKTIENILQTQPRVQNFNKILSLLNLNTQIIPDFLQNYQAQLLCYLCNYIPYSEHEQFVHIGIYNMIVIQPHFNYSVKLSLLAIKWCIKKGLIDQAIKIYEMKELENAFWCGEYNVAVSQFYDFFSMYYASVGKYESSIQLAKLSLKNIIKIVGPNELPIADKHYQLGNIYFKMGKKEEALRQYIKTKDILTTHNQVHINQYAIILLKIAALELNFGKIVDCINNCLQALQIFDQTQTNEENQIGTFQVLSRCYQITKKDKENMKIGEIVAQKFNQTENFLIFQRMAKIVLYIRIKSLSSVQNKAFLAIITKLQDQNTQKTYNESFTFLHRKSQSENILKKVIMFLDNISALYQQAIRKDLFRRYKSLDLNTKSQAQQMLVMFDALGCLIGFNYMLGSLKDYQ